MLVHNYGLFWERKLVFWGRGSMAGHLKGIPLKNVTDDPVDFREQQGTYCLYDEGFRLVYIGQAGGKNDQRLFDRLRQHRDDYISNRWTKFSWFGVRKVIGDRRLKAVKENAKASITDVLNHIEAILIAAAEPVYNRQGGRFGEHVTQYRQYRDDHALGPTTQEMVKDLWDELE